MSLEASLVIAASNILVKLIDIATINRKKHLDKPEVERIIDDYIIKHGLVMQTKREIIAVLVKEEVVAPDGQLQLPPSRELPALREKTLRALWDTSLYKIVSVFSEKALDVPKSSRMEDGVPLQLWDYHGGANQHWKVIPVGGHSDLFKIHSPYSTKVLDVPEPRIDNGTQIIQWGYHGGVNQHWRLFPIDGNGEVFKITSEWSGKSLDAPQSKTENGTQIIQWSWHGGTNQQWRLTRIK